MNDVIVELVNHCVERMMIVKMEKFAKVKSVQLAAEQTQDAPITYRASTNNVKIHVKNQQLVELTQFVQLIIIKFNARVKNHLLETLKSVANIHQFLVKSMTIVLRVKLVTEKNADLLVAMIKIVCLMKDACVELAAQFVVQTVNVVKTSFVKIEFVKLVVDQMFRAVKNNPASTNNVQIHVQCQDNVEFVQHVTFSIMQFNAVVRREWLEIHSPDVLLHLSLATATVNVMSPNDIASQSVKHQPTVHAVNLAIEAIAEQNVTLALALPVNFAKEMSALKVVESIPIVQTKCLVLKENVKILVLKVNAETRPFVVQQTIVLCVSVQMDLLENLLSNVFKLNAKLTRIVILTKNVCPALARTLAWNAVFVVSMLNVVSKIVKPHVCAYLVSTVTQKLSAKKRELTLAREILAESTASALTHRMDLNASANLDALEMLRAVVLVTAS